MNTSAEPLRWGILSTGRIAGTFAEALARSATGRLVAVGSRTTEAAQAFAARQGGARAYGSYEALLSDPEVEAVYIATPHPHHVEWVVRAAEAGKHILCEKPIGVNQAEAMVMIAAAREHGVTLMEAYMYRCHPQTQRVVELVRTGAIGRIRSIQSTFSFRSEFNPESRLWSNDSAGGGILDVGGYPLSYVRLLAGAADGLPFADPVAVAGAGYLHPETGVDVYAAATLKFANGIVAQVATGVGLIQDNTLRIYGDDGRIEVPRAFLFAREPEPMTFQVHRRGAPAPEAVTVQSERGLYTYEADAFAAAVRAGGREVPACTWADTLGNLGAQDAWRGAIGLVYEQERPERFAHTHARRPLARREPAAMRYGRVEGLVKPVARLVMGCDNQRTMPHAAAVWDDYFERGGNTFDTAFIYGGGLMETLLGHWLRHRGVRDEVVVIGKGAHTPLCGPEWIGRQLSVSLERLQTDHVDLYLMHRDNPEVPVGEFVDALNEQVRAGRMKVFGGSNWSLARVAAANRYAKRKGLQGFGAVSNNLSLARMVDPVWAGCVACGDVESRRWLKQHALPNFAWSSQARGFFTERAGPERREDAELVRCWYAEDNFERRRRAQELAAEKGVSVINIAAAYVLSQPFPSFALIGPRTIAETVSSLECLKVGLSPRELAWLNLERERR